MADISKIDMNRINGLLDKFEEITNKLNSMKYVVETGSNENGWYRIWSDGFIEQGGIMPIATTDTNVTITLPISFSNTNYQIVMTLYNNSSLLSSGDTWSSRFFMIFDKTKSSFVKRIAKTSFGDSFYACGY